MPSNAMQGLKSKGGGSGRKFYHKGKDALICCHQPHPNPCVDKGCIKYKEYEGTAELDLERCIGKAPWPGGSLPLSQ